MASRRIEVLKNHLHGVPSIIPTACGVSSSTQVHDLPISPEDSYQYQEKGFFVRRRLYNLEELAGYSQRFSDICNEKVDKGFLIRIMKDVASLDKPQNEFTVNKVQDFGEDPVLSEYCTKPAALDIVQSLVGNDIMAMHTMLINKPPDTGKKTSRHPLHQDLWYFPFRPADKIVCSWTAMERVHRGNGCLVVYPGTHRGELLDHGYPDWEGGVNKMYHGIKNMPSDVGEPLYLEMEPGDTVFFHPLLFHGSGSNKTSGFRKAISCHYASSNCHYIDVSNLPQRAIAKEVEDVVKKKGLDITYVDAWRLRGVLVRGERIQL